MVSEDTLRRRIVELAPWYQNIELADGISTKDLTGTRDIFSGHDIPAPLWRAIAKDLPDLTGARVLDIGCNAGYMSFAAKRLGAGYVLGIDANVGAGSTSFVEQAVFCREALGLDVEFQEQSFFDFEPEQPFGLVLFCGVLYHLEDYATAIDKVASFAAPGGLIVLETAIEPVTLTLPGGRDYHGDTTTFFVPSVAVLLELVRERGLRIEIVRDLGRRAIVFARRR